MYPAAADVDAYLARIGHQGSRAATRETLGALHRLHPAAIAFENLDAFLRRPVPVEPDGIAAKLVGARRGGWCFEHNILFATILRALGFSVAGLAARVVWGRAEDAVSPRSHMLLEIDLDGAHFIADVGFGGLTQTAPLVLEPDLAQETPHETFRFVERDGEYRSQALVGGEWRTLYRFDRQRQFPVDYAVSSHYLSTHPQSPFLGTVMAARPFDGGRHALLGNRLTTRHADGRAEQALAASPEALREVLDDVFGFDVPDTDRFDAMARRAGLFEGG